MVKFLTTDELIETLRREDPSGARRVVIEGRFVDSVRQRDGACVEIRPGEPEARTPDSLPISSGPRVRY